MRRIILLLGIALTAIQASAQFSKPRRQYVEYIVSTNNPSRNYELNENASLKIEAYKGGIPLNGVKVYYKTGDEMMTPEKNDSAVFNNGVATINLGTRKEPGFKACDLKFTVYDKTYKDLVKVGFAPEKIKPFTAMPEDFDKFWNKAIKEVEKIDLTPEITPLPSYSTKNVDVFLVKLTVGKNGRNMYGYLSKPKDGKKHPVLFEPPGAGAKKITPTTYYSENGFIHFKINIHSGCNSELSDDMFETARKIADNYNRNGIENKEQFYYKDVYAGCSRCVDFLCTLPEWDGKNVGVTGGSQGGALTIITAALNKKVTFCAPFYPALCDLNGFQHNRAGGWPKYFQKGNEKQGAEHTLEYYDVVNFARRLTCPIFFSFGYNDDTCSPTSTYGTYNEIKSPKTLSITPTSGHWRFPETNDESVKWMQKMAE
ncbi:acetylxylan esterase [Xylanibacter muris]|uniref:Prolyl oligopeptidase family serine peptidase n=1 Tax=Xylanibacter muris TaxID=2736290 RepID=A0ABX2AM89_9BACT|nr:acetylxylan esterase [Xylanibacter muris]NPD92139.1 prolyl oligopeptidase family serine peptidase [Xylanibacter muris]